MKKIIYIMACIVIVLVLAACGAQQTPAVQDTQAQTEQTKESTALTPESAQGETAELEKQPEQTALARTAFEQYEAALDGKGISFEKVQMAAEIVGAAEGAKYEVDGGAVELYIFDADGEAYKTAEDKQALTMQGYGDFPATVENGMALIVSDVESEPYLEIFRSLTVAE